MKTYRFIGIIVLLFTKIIVSQDVEYARYLVRMLCSHAMAGRGYTNHEIDTAAQFIAAEFQKNGILPLIKDGYFQPFSYKVNVFPKASLQIDGQKLIPGYDFVVSPLSPGLQGKFKALWYVPKDTTFKFPKRFKSHFVVIPVYAIKKEVKDKLYKMYRPLLEKSQGIIVLDTVAFIGHVAMYEPMYAHPLIKLSPSVVKSIIRQKEKIHNIEINLTSVYTTYEAKNVIGYVQGREYPDSFIIVSAHYDHLGRLDTAAFRGANDNASGVAMMMDLAKTIKNNSFRPKYSVIFIAFAGEEVGLKGSFYFVNNSPIELSRIKFVMNLDMVGTGSDGIGVVNSTAYPTYSKLLTDINEKNHYLQNIKLRGESNNSDHAPFHLKKIPSFFIHTMGPEHPYYHQVQDRPDLPFTAYKEVFSLVLDFIYAL
jgi:hypothetical protein